MGGWQGRKALPRVLIFFVHVRVHVQKAKDGGRGGRERSAEAVVYQTESWLVCNTAALNDLQNAWHLEESEKKKKWRQGDWEKMKENRIVLFKD